MRMTRSKPAFGHLLLPFSNAPVFFAAYGLFHDETFHQIISYVRSLNACALPVTSLWSCVDFFQSLFYFVDQYEETNLCDKTLDLNL